MKGLLIFNKYSEVLFSKHDGNFARHIKKLGTERGIINPEDNVDKELFNDVLMQIFTPICTSYKVMKYEYGNSYYSIQGENDVNMVFEEFMEYLFVHIGVEDAHWLKRALQIYINFVKHWCGPDVSILKKNKSSAVFFSNIIDTWIQLQNSDQAILVEAVEESMVKTDLHLDTQRILQEVTRKLKSRTEFSCIYAMILVKNILLSSFSSQGTKCLMASDIMFLNLLCKALRFFPNTDPTNLVKSSENIDVGATSVESNNKEHYKTEVPSFYHPVQLGNSPLLFPHRTERVQYDEQSSHLVLLSGSMASLTPHVVHISLLNDDVSFVVVSETNHAAISAALYDVFSALSLLQTLHIQKKFEDIKITFKDLSTSIKKLFNICKKRKNSRSEIENCIKKLQSLWKLMEKLYVKYIETGELKHLIPVDSQITIFSNDLKELSKYTCWDTSVTEHGREAVLEIRSFVKCRLAGIGDFLKVKALSNVAMESRTSLDINKYLEKFPGLLHFIYIDRSNHRLITPSLNFSSEETIKVTMKEVWSMIDFSRKRLQEGCFTVTWKENSTNYAYFLWFQNNKGVPIVPSKFQKHMCQSLSLPGILCGDFYKELREMCFPKISPLKICCYELYCIYLD